MKVISFSYFRKYMVGCTIARYKWLRYSKHDNGGYCLPCVLFARAGVNPGVDPGVLVSKPFVNFKRATE